MRLIRIILFITLLYTCAIAQDKVNINFSNISLNDLIKLVAKVTDKNILMPYQLNGKVTFLSQKPIYKGDLFSILVSTLKSKGYTLVKHEDYYKVVPSVNAARDNIPVVRTTQNGSGYTMITQAVKIKNINVNVIAAKIRYLLSPSARLETLKNSNTLLITDFPKNIKTAKQVITELEYNNKKIVRIIHIHYANVSTLQRNLFIIASSIFNSTIKSQQVKILPDLNINSLIIVGNRKNVDKLTALVKKLDTKTLNTKKVKIFVLKNSNAKNVFNTLNSIYNKEHYSDVSLKPLISVSIATNSIIVVAQPVVLQEIHAIIARLDREKYQVYVKAKIIQINSNKAKQIGIQYGFSAGDVSSSGLYAMSANFGNTSLTNLANSSVLNYLGTIGSGVKTAFALGAALDFLQSHDASKSLSSPSILCLNNKQSSIYVGKSISIQTGTISNAISGSNLTQTYQRYNIGLTLKIKPRVSSKDKVTLNVETILENIVSTGANTPSGQPITSKQEVKTQVILRNGESIVIGGLVKHASSLSKSKIPVLGDIPFIGKWLFSSNTKATSNENIVVILTPYVISKSDNISKLQEDLGLLSILQKEYNKKVFAKLEKKATKEKDTTNSDKQIKNSIFGDN